MIPMWPAEWYLDIGVLLLALALDFALPEPPSPLHPVVWMGKLVSIMERVSPRTGRVLPFLAGVVITVVVVTASGGVAWLAVWGLRELGAVAYVIGGAVLLKTTFSVRGLTTAAQSTRQVLEEGSLGDARYSLRSLVSRDAQTLEAPQVAGAAIESVAENTTDSYIGPWLAFAVFGLPGAFAYRAVNTLDSMLGYRGWYEFLGKASARLDDLVNLVPARISATLVVLAGALSGLSAVSDWATMWREHRGTESPNAGWTISAISGVMGVRLEKPGHYRLGEGFREPVPTDIGRAVELARLVALLGVLAALLVLVGRQALMS